ncbi:MAG: FAD-dependent oxidoreductase [Gammaproteobacteria bacterium]|jgi:2-octaprenyl-3-methyl-6-methoxy-1,4-benzoquinol hydroxylase/2-octaprenylphenol hydroxylase|nr:FAD-dependent oxidoreductase [Gammaproteobacteria bacterium]
MNRNERSGNFDVVVVGAGMVGAAAAALLARSGFSVAVIESREPQPFDASKSVGLRVSAFSPGSADILNEAGAWRQLERQRLCPYRRMVVEDRSETVSMEFESVEFGLERLGTIVENELVQWSLWQSLLAMGGVELYCPDSVTGLDNSGDRPVVSLASGSTVECGLLVAADGANSGIRHMLGIRQNHWEYGQQGLVSVVHTTTPNRGVAWQRFHEDGPLAFLPLHDGSSSIVWSLPDAEADRLLALEDKLFLAELENAVAGGQGHWPDRPTACGPRASFPLTMRLSERYTARHAVLMGDAAHVVHPLAGQGVNLGLLDAAGLVEVLVDARNRKVEFANEKSLEKYGRWRRSEAEVMAMGMHGIKGFFIPEELGPLRRMGIGLVAGSWMAKEAFIRRATGRNRNAPALARGTGLTEMLSNKLT